MTSIIIFAPVLFYRLLIFRSFFALGGQLIILHGNDNGITFFYLICQDHLGCQGLHVLLDITLSKAVHRRPDHKHCPRYTAYASSDQTGWSAAYPPDVCSDRHDQMNDAADIVLGQRLEQDCLIQTVQKLRTE